MKFLAAMYVNNEQFTIGSSRFLHPNDIISWFPITDDIQWYYVVRQVGSMAECYSDTSTTCDDIEEANVPKYTEKSTQTDAIIAQRTINRKTKKATTEKVPSGSDSDSDEHIKKPTFKSKTTKKGQTSRTTRRTMAQNATNASPSTTPEISAPTTSIANETNPVEEQPRSKFSKYNYRNIQYCFWVNILFYIFFFESETVLSVY